MLIIGSIACIGLFLIEIQGILAGTMRPPDIHNPIPEMIRWSMFVVASFAGAFVGSVSYSHFNESPRHRSSWLYGLTATSLGLGVFGAIFFTALFVPEILARGDILSSPPALIGFIAILLVTYLSPFLFAALLYVKSIRYKGPIH